MTQEPPYLYLTTTGRKTGNPHTIEIWFVQHDDAYYIVAERRYEADWVKNIQQNHALSLRIGERDAPLMHGRGRVVKNEVVDGDLITVVKRKMQFKYGWSDGLIVELKPDVSPT